MHDARELDVRDVAGGGVDPVEIPAGFPSVWIVIGKEAASVCL
jgi:hypothetical protein